MRERGGTVAVIVLIRGTWGKPALCGIPGVDEKRWGSLRWRIWDVKPKTLTHRDIDRFAGVEEMPALGDVSDTLELGVGREDQEVDSTQDCGGKVEEEEGCRSRSHWLVGKGGMANGGLVLF